MSRCLNDHETPAHTKGLIVALALSAGAFALSVANLPPLPVSFEVIATTTDGNTYVAGSGDTCRDAWRNTTYPANWRTLVCREAR